MTEYTCYDCTGRGGELVVFNVSVGGKSYDYKPNCPICGQLSTVETLDTYFERKDDDRYSVSQ